MREQVQIPFKDKIVTLNFEEFDDEIDIDRLTFIDYSNIHAEFLTIASLYNRVGLWRAEAESAVAQARLHRKVQEAEKSQHYRKQLRITTGEGTNKKIKYPTISEVENAVTLDEDIQALRKKEILLGKNFGYMDSLFWSVKSKEKKIDRLIEGSQLKPEDFEKNIAEGRWNGILIKCQDKLIKG